MMSGGFNLQISKIFGTSSERSSQVTTQDNLVAYTASGGVVISQINRKTLEVEWQKFYSANNVLDHELISLSASGKLDQFEYPIYPETEVINREGSVTFSKESMEGTSSSGNSNSGSSAHHNVHDISKPIRVRRNYEDFGSSTTSSSNSSLANRVRSINCIAISPDKKLLAVGEVGYQPRIIVYSLAKDSMAIPLMIIQEHQFGINSLSFSPDSKKLCSLGLVNDGFLIVWKLVGKKFTFHGSNKCSSVVNRMIWHDDVIITAGLRNIKIWKESNLDASSYNSPSKRSSLIIKGRNVLLKKFLNSNFIDMVVMNYNEILVLTDQGDLTMINLDEESMVLKKIANLPSNTNQILVDSIGENLIIAGSKVEILSIDHLLNEYGSILSIGDDPDSIEAIKPTPSSPTKIVKRTGVLALKELFEGERFVYLKDNEELIAVNETDLRDYKAVMNPLLKDIGGLKKCFNNDIIIWSKTGLVKRLVGNNELETIHAIVLPSDEVVDNGVNAVDSNGDELVIGDRYGSLYFLQRSSEPTEDSVIRNSGFRESQIIRAHESSINDVSLFKFGNFLFCACVSRDRTIQIFRKVDETWELFQTISVHKGNVMRVAFDKNRLYSASSDRTLSIHEFVSDPETHQIKVYQEKMISLKSSPATFLVSGNDLAISTIDKIVTIYDLKTLEVKRTLKLFNSHHDSLLVDNLTIDISRNCIFVSATDKSVRSFDYTDGRLLSTSWGHSETILNLIPSDDSLISASTDGCMFIRDILNYEHIPQTVPSSPVDAATSNTTLISQEDREKPDKGLTRRNTISLTNTPIIKRSSMNRVERKVLNTEPPKPSLIQSGGLSRTPSLRTRNTNVMRTPSNGADKEGKLVTTKGTNLSPRSPTPRTLSRSSISSGLSPTTRSSIASRLRNAGGADDNRNNAESTFISPKTRSPLISKKNSAGVSSITNKLTQLNLIEHNKEEPVNDLKSQMDELIYKLKQFQKTYINEIENNEGLNTLELSRHLRLTNGLITDFDEEDLLNGFTNKVFAKLDEKMIYYNTVNKENELN